MIYNIYGLAFPNSLNFDPFSNSIRLCYYHYIVIIAFQILEHEIDVVHSGKLNPAWGFRSVKEVQESSFLVGR